MTKLTNAGSKGTRLGTHVIGQDKKARLSKFEEIINIMSITNITYNLLLILLKIYHTLKNGKYRRTTLFK